MKNHIAVKFIAICLCAVFLMTGVISAVGIVMLASADLYNHNVTDAYEENFRNVREGFANSLVFRYASMEEGGCSSVLIDEYYDTDWIYYGTFRWGSFAYSVRNAKGEELASSGNLNLPNATHYEIPVTNGSYLTVVPEDQVPASAWVANTMPGWEELEEEIPEKIPEPVPTDSPTESPTEAPTEAPTVPATEATEESAAEESPTEAAAEAGEEPEPTAETTAESEATEPSSALALADSGIAVARMSAGPKEGRFSTVEDYANAFPYSYYDYMQEEQMQVWLCYSTTSDYTVDLYLQPDALENYQTWVFLGYMWNWRNDLFLVMGISLLLFAACAVYLCCAAGRKPGSTEVRPVALNRTPLDFYALASAAVILALMYLNWRFQYDLIKRSLLLAMTTAMGSCFISSLMLVGLGFAFAAQVKTPDGFWWRRSVIGQVLLTLRWLLIRLWKGLRWTVVRIPAAFRGLRKMVMTLVMAFTVACRKLGHKIGGIVKKFTGLIPLMWQWLLAMGIVIFDLALTISTGSLFFIVLGLILAIAVTVYGACSFGSLLDAARKMRQGDLETKVDDKYLLGCFQNFAEELNGIAGVAVTATQKQLKSERMKTELITNVSHDIKTPLTSIINYVDLMQKPHTEAEQTAYLEVLDRQSHRLKKLIDDLMEMSKASSGTLTVDITTVDASEAVSQALGEFSDKLDAARLTPVFRQSDQVVNMKADGRLAWRVMSNILGNAVKYALPGTRLYVDLMELDGKVLISMKNISREELNVSSDELLERFVRGDASRNTEGSGLGLNIAKTLMELQHGQLELLVDGDLFKVTMIFPAA